MQWIRSSQTPISNANNKLAHSRRAGQWTYVREKAVRALARIDPKTTAQDVIPVMVELMRCPQCAVENCVQCVHFSSEEVAAFGSEAITAIQDAVQHQSQQDQSR